MLLKSQDTRFLNWKVNNTLHHIKELKKRLPWQQFKNTKRMVCSLGSDYGYSGHTTKGHNFDLYPPLKQLMDELNLELNTNFNSVLINWYPKDSYVGIGAHKDDEESLVKEQPVVSISLGASCIFELKDTYKGPTNEHIKIELKDGDVFVMGTNCQQYYYHFIDYTQMEEDRISLTFRTFQ